LRGSDLLTGAKKSPNGTVSELEAGKKSSFLGRYLPNFGLETRGKPSVV
jgi:hypothetical protein